jgi:hypothetical protein
MAPADWPRRQVAPDPALLGQLRQAGLPHTVQLHLLTAAIGVGDRRIRVLMDGDGRIIGPRAYSRPRSASAAVLLLAGVLGAGWQWAATTSADDGGKTALMAQAVSAASAASAASAMSAASAASAATAAAAASAMSAASAASAAAVLALPASTASAAVTILPTSPITAPITSPITAPITVATPPAEPAADAPPLGRIRPALSDDERRIAKLQAARLRRAPDAASTAASAGPAGALPATVYAVVTRPSRQREAAVHSLAVMRAARARLSSPAPERSELMQDQGQWRAAWWPFASQLDAERARSMLAARGLKAEVVAF